MTKNIFVWELIIFDPSPCSNLKYAGLRRFSNRFRENLTSTTLIFGASLLPHPTLRHSGSSRLSRSDSPLSWVSRLYLEAPPAGCSDRCSLCSSVKAFPRTSTCRAMRRNTTVQKCSGGGSGRLPPQPEKTR